MPDKYEFTGVIIKVSSIIPVTGRFKEKCTFIVKSDNDDREIAFLIFDSQIYDLLQPLDLLDKVKVTFTIKSREYNGSYTTNCFAIDIVKIVQKKAYNAGGNYGPWGGFGGGKKQQQPKYVNYFDGCLNKDMTKKKYRELALQYHPDKPTGDSDIMKEINRQYEVWK